MYSLLQNSKKSFLNKNNVRTLKRKLEIRKQKRSQGFNVQPLEKHELKKANISLSSDGTLLHPHSKVVFSSKEKYKRKTEKETLSSNDESNLTGRPEDISSRVLDRFQVIFNFN